MSNLQKFVSQTQTYKECRKQVDVRKSQGEKCDLQQNKRKNSVANGVKN